MQCVNTSINMAQNAAPPTFMNPPKDYLAWSLFNFMFLNAFCLGYVATVYSIKVRVMYIIPLTFTSSYFQAYKNRIA
uniref:Uncharacterized protein n=1 Tax=Eptatretus burgeri TaxID=7764 RepID=A0A8C4QAY0_EPTBU